MTFNVAVALTSRVPKVTDAGTIAALIGIDHRKRALGVLQAGEGRVEAIDVVITAAAEEHVALRAEAGTGLECTAVELDLAELGGRQVRVGSRVAPSAASLITSTVGALVLPMMILP